MNIGLSSDSHLNAISPNHRSKQDTGLGANCDLPSYGCIFRDEAIVGNEFGLVLNAHGMSSMEMVSEVAKTFGDFPAKAETLVGSAT